MVSVSATTYKDWRYLLVLVKRNAAAVDVLDFSAFVRVHGFGPLDAIYPKSHGQLDPPPKFLTTGALVRKWRGFNKQRQLYELERLSNDEEKRLVTESRSRSRAARIERREAGRAPAPASDIAHVEQLAAGSSTQSGELGGREASPLVASGSNAESAEPMEVINLPEDDDDPSARVDVVESGMDGADGVESPPHRTDPVTTGPPPTRYKRVLEEELDSCTSQCRGIRVEIIRRSNSRHKEQIERGFFHLVGNAFREKGSVISNSHGWIYGPEVMGFLMDENRRDEDANYSWKCVQSGGAWAFHRNNCGSDPSAHKE